MPAVPLTRGRDARPGLPFPSHGGRPSAQTGSGAFGARPPFSLDGSPPVPRLRAHVSVCRHRRVRPALTVWTCLTPGALSVYFGSCWGRFFSFPFPVPFALLSCWYFRTRDSASTLARIAQHPSRPVSCPPPVSASNRDFSPVSGMFWGKGRVHGLQLSVGMAQPSQP